MSVVHTECTESPGKPVCSPSPQSLPQAELYTNREITEVTLPDSTLVTLRVVVVFFNQKTLIQCGGQTDVSSDGVQLTDEGW